MVRNILVYHFDLLFAVSTSETTSSLEQERYLSVLVCATPLSALRQGSAWHMSDSTLSIDSLLLAAEDHAQGSGTLTPEVSRRANPFNKAMGTLRYIMIFCTFCF
jgi:myotubularin-related protein 5/13